MNYCPSVQMRWLRVNNAERDIMEFQRSDIGWLSKPLVFILYVKQQFLSSHYSNILFMKWCSNWVAGIDLGISLTNERLRYNVTSPLIGWAHTYNNPWNFMTWDPVDIRAKLPEAIWIRTFFTGCKWDVTCRAHNRSYAHSSYRMCVL